MLKYLEMHASIFFFHMYFPPFESLFSLQPSNRFHIYFKDYLNVLTEFTQVPLWAQLVKNVLTQYGRPGWEDPWRALSTPVFCTGEFHGLWVGCDWVTASLRVEGEEEISVVEAFAIGAVSHKNYQFNFWHGKACHLSSNSYFPFS